MVNKFNQATSTDQRAVERATQPPLQRAEVIKCFDHPDENGYHQVTVQLYVDGSEERALVLAPKQGEVALPERGEDVLVARDGAGDAIVVGSFYPRVDEQGRSIPDSVPAHECGERILGNGSDGQVRIDDAGNVYLDSAPGASVFINGRNVSADTIAIQEDGTQVSSGRNTLTVQEDGTTVLSGSGNALVQNNGANVA